MASSKHPLSGHEADENRLPADDLKTNPGIGQSKGFSTAGGNFEDVEGEATSEGDEPNDATLERAITKDEKSRGPTDRGVDR
jgi:hypothetical protein